MCKQKSNTFFKQKKKKKIVDIQVEGEKKKKKASEHGPLSTCTRAFLSHHGFYFLPSSFLPIWGRKLFGGSREKKPGPHHLFSLPLLPTKHPPRSIHSSFSLSFFFFFFPKIHSQTHYKTRQNKKLRERERERERESSFRLKNWWLLKIKLDTKAN